MISNGLLVSKHYPISIQTSSQVWKGNFYFGTREGYIFKVGEK